MTRHAERLTIRDVEGQRRFNAARNDVARFDANSRGPASLTRVVVSGQHLLSPSGRECARRVVDRTRKGLARCSDAGPRTELSRRGPARVHRKQPAAPLTRDTLFSCFPCRSNTGWGAELLPRHGARVHPDATTTLPARDGVRLPAGPARRSGAGHSPAVCDGLTRVGAEPAGPTPRHELAAAHAAGTRRCDAFPVIVERALRCSPFTGARAVGIARPVNRATAVGARLLHAPRLSLPDSEAVALARTVSQSRMTDGLSAPVAGLCVASLHGSDATGAAFRTVGVFGLVNGPAAERATLRVWRGHRHLEIRAIT
jgi:hypothetical protein